MYKLICLLFIFTLTSSVHAQFSQVEDAMSRGKQKGLRIHLDTFDKSIANDAVIKAMSDQDHKVNPSVLSFNELFFDNITITTISADPIDFYAKIKEVDSSIILFADLGTRFLDVESSNREGAAMQQLAAAVRQHIREIYKQRNIDSLKKKIKLTENLLERATDDLKAANNTIKNDIKGAADNDKTIVETETRLKDEKAQIAVLDSIRRIKEKEFDAFPLAHLKAVNELKNNALDKNRSIRKNLIRSNVRSTEKITEYETEMQLNKSALDVAKDDPKATKKLMKANQQLNTKINDEKLKINMNDASIKTINGVIASDSIILRTNNDSLIVFDENGRKKEMRQMDNKKEKLLESTQKHQADIDRNRMESEQRKKEAEEIAKKLDGMKASQDEYSKTLEKLKAELATLTKK